MKKITGKILYILSRSKLLYKFSTKVVDYYRSENNCDIDTNGEMYFIYNNKKKFDVIFDAGANVGEWTDLVSKIIPNARIYSFEPSLQTFKTLSTKKFVSNISLHNIGLGENDETKDFYIYGEDSTLNSVFSRKLPGDIYTTEPKIEKAQFETLDSFCLKNKIRRISFLKIDTEGNELSVLKGAKEYISSGKIDAIQFEYGGTYIDAGVLLKDIFIFFKDKPYVIYKMMQNRLQECDVYTASLENFQYSNYVAILKK